MSDTFFGEDVLNSDLPVLIGYWAEWYEPCKMIAPVLEEIAGEYAGKIKIAKLDIDENPQSPTRYRIRSIPTLMMFVDGDIAGTKIGAVSRSHLTEFIDTSIR